MIIALLAVAGFILGAAEPVNLFQKRPWRVMRSAKNTVIDNIGKEYHCIGNGKTGEGVFIVYDFKSAVSDKIVITAESKVAEIPAGRTIVGFGAAGSSFTSKSSNPVIFRALATARTAIAVPLALPSVE